MFYVLMFGLYPIINKYFEMVRLRPVEYALKLLYFNAAAIGAIYLAAKLLGIDFMDGMPSGRYGAALLLLLGNGVFLIYDLALTRCVYMYVTRFQKHIRKRFGLKNDITL